MNTRDLPGYGDPQTWGAICSPNDPRYAEDIGAEEAIEAIAEHVEAERLASVAWVEDAFSELTCEDYKVMAAAIASGNSHRAGELLNESVVRIVKADAMKEARIRYERMRREDEADAAAARMEC